MERIDERTVQVVRAVLPFREDDVTVLAGTRGIVVGYSERTEGGVFLDVLWEGYVFSGDARLDTFHGLRVDAPVGEVEVIETGRLLDVSVTQELRDEARRVARGDQ